MKATTVKVWDPLVRVFHWSLVTCFVAAWLTADDAKTLHLAAGYVGLGLVAIRIFWGFAGTEHARFRDFVKGPKAVVAYIMAMLRGEEPRYLGHNPAGGAMVLALLLCILVLALTGWLYTTDAYFGDEWLEEIHEATAYLMLSLVVAHVAGVVWESLRHGENLVRSMVTGLKPATIEIGDTENSVDGTGRSPRPT